MVVTVAVVTAALVAVAEVVTSAVVGLAADAVSVAVGLVIEEGMAEDFMAVTGIAADRSDWLKDYVVRTATATEASQV